MLNKRIIYDLINIANFFDEGGFSKEADDITEISVRLAQSPYPEEDEIDTPDSPSGKLNMYKVRDAAFDALENGIGDFIKLLSEFIFQRIKEPIQNSKFVSIKPNESEQKEDEMHAQKQLDRIFYRVLPLFKEYKEEYATAPINNDYLRIRLRNDFAKKVSNIIMIITETNNEKSL